MNVNKALLPDSFINFIRPHLPATQNIEEFIQYCAKPLRKSIRVNTLKVDLIEFTQKMTQQGWLLTAIPWCETGFWVEATTNETQAISLGNTAEHITGQFYIQEASSMLPPQALVYKNNAQVVLDVASAPGSKTTQLAALMQNKGVILANEYSSSRVKVLAANIQRCAVTNTAVTHMDGRLFEHLPETFDSILLDAPCSGEGTVRKDPDSMKNWTEQSVHDIAATQTDLIHAAFKALKVNGVLIYSTCTLNPYENQKVCLALQASYPEQVEFEPLNDLFEGAENSMTALGFLHVWPQIYDSEGFFVARIRKTGSIIQKDASQNNPFSRLGKFPFLPLSKTAKNALQDYLVQQFNCSDFPITNCYQRNNDIWYLPDGLSTLQGKLKFSRVGTKVAELAKHGIKPAHELAINFSHLFNQQIVALSTEQAQQYLRGQNIDLDFDLSHLAKGEVVVSYQDQALGFAKNLSQMLKNQLPRALVKDNLNLCHKI